MSTELVLVRHAHAEWSPDEARPLSSKGRADAERLADALVHLQPAHVFSSPYARARETVEPLARRIGVPWAYRFEAYTPASKRKLGYYALPLLWRDHVIGWANAALRDGGLAVQTGYVAGRAPRDAGFRAALDDELGRLSKFLGLGG